MNAGKQVVPSTKAIDWVTQNYWCKSADRGKIAHYVANKLVIPIWCPQNSLFIMGGSFQQNMVRWTDRRSEMLMVTTEEGLHNSNVAPHLKCMHSHEPLQPLAPIPILTLPRP